MVDSDGRGEYVCFSSFSHSYSLPLIRLSSCCACVFFSSSIKWREQFYESFLFPLFLFPSPPPLLLLLRLRSNNSSSSSPATINNTTRWSNQRSLYEQQCFFPSLADDARARAVKPPSVYIYRLSMSIFLTIFFFRLEWPQRAHFNLTSSSAFVSFNAAIVMLLVMSNDHQGTFVFIGIFQRASSIDLGSSSMLNQLIHRKRPLGRRTSPQETSVMFEDVSVIGRVHSLSQDSSQHVLNSRLVHFLPTMSKSLFFPNE